MGGSLGHLGEGDPCYGGRILEQHAVWASGLQGAVARVVEKAGLLSRLLREGEDGGPPASSPADASTYAVADSSVQFASAIPDEHSAPEHAGDIDTNAGVLTYLCAQQR